MADLPNQLDDLWKDWDKQTLEEKYKRLKETVRREGKVLFSRKDCQEQIKKALEVAKAIELDPKAAEVFMTPPKKWTAAHDPKSQRARELGKALARRDRLWVTPKMDVSDEMLDRLYNKGLGSAESEKAQR